MRKLQLAGGAAAKGQPPRMPLAYLMLSPRDLYEPKGYLALSEVNIHGENNYARIGQGGTEILHGAPSGSWVGLSVDLEAGKRYLLDFKLRLNTTGDGTIHVLTGNSSQEFHLKGFVGQHVLFVLQAVTSGRTVLFTTCSTGSYTFYSVEVNKL